MGCAHRNWESWLVHRSPRRRPAVQKRGSRSGGLSVADGGARVGRVNDNGSSAGASRCASGALPGRFGAPAVRRRGRRGGAGSVVRVGCASGALFRRNGAGWGCGFGPKSVFRCASGALFVQLVGGHDFLSLAPSSAWVRPGQRPSTATVRTGLLIARILYQGGRKSQAKSVRTRRGQARNNPGPRQQGRHPPQVHSPIRDLTESLLPNRGFALRALTIKTMLANIVNIETTPAAC
jgi:hypothetical protein